MPRLTKEMYWLAQDIFCRYVAQCELAPKGDIKQIAQTCIALTSEFFAAFESTQQALSKSEQRALARDLPNALSQALVNESSEVAKALSMKGKRQEPEEEEESEEERKDPLPVGDGKTGGGPMPKAWTNKPQELPAKAPAPLPSTKGKKSSPAPGAPGDAPKAPPARKVVKRRAK
jgi:hypothetical protein